MSSGEQDLEFLICKVPSEHAQDLRELITNYAMEQRVFLEYVPLGDSRTGLPKEPSYDKNHLQEIPTEVPLLETRSGQKYTVNHDSSYITPRYFDKGQTLHIVGANPLKHFAEEKFGKPEIGTRLFNSVMRGGDLNHIMYRTPAYAGGIIVETMPLLMENIQTKKIKLMYFGEKSMACLEALMDEVLTPEATEENI
jgi:hypothetical protein